MDNIYVSNKEEIINNLEVIWNYMKLNQKLEKCDLIIGCGCANLEIPIKCANLLKEGYASKILFAGGLGKITKNNFNKSEAEIYREIAIKNGVNEQDIIIEMQSTNTGDNFRFGLKILNDNNIKCDKILIVHKPLNERRTLSSAKAILKGKKILITSPDSTFDEYINYLDNQTYEKIYNEISVIVGDIQRLIIYPQFGWQIKNDVPESVLKSYYYLKNIGFSKYILSKEQINILINKFGLIDSQEENYFN